jgi:hypothetical protein
MSTQVDQSTGVRPTWHGQRRGFDLNQLGLNLNWFWQRLYVNRWQIRQRRLWNLDRMPTARAFGLRANLVKRCFESLLAMGAVESEHGRSPRLCEK